MRSRLRLFVPIALVLIAMVPHVAMASDLECPGCFEICDWWPGLMTLCFKAPDGMVGACRCYERPCRNDGAYCTVITVTP